MFRVAEEGVLHDGALADRQQDHHTGSRLSLVPYSGKLQVRGSEQLPYHRHPTSVFVSTGLVGASGAPC